jgi:hypothetical protein
MLTPGIYYPAKNAHRQLLATLPGKNIYPVGADYIYYSEGPVFYANQHAGLIGELVHIYINGELHGTAPILDATGLYVYEFAPVYGTLEIKSAFYDLTEASQTFFCVNLYTLLAASATIWSEQRKANMLLLANQYLTPQTTGIFRGQADQQAMSDSFGEAIGFPQPPDWPFERYALAMGGYPAMGLPSIYGALPKGSSVGAIKDIVQAVTQYGMTADDFRQLQGVGWQMGQTGNYNHRFRYSGNPLAPVLDTDPTGASGPHYFLPYNQYEVNLTYAARMTAAIQVWVNGRELFSPNFYARTQGSVTTVWVAGTVEGDHVTIHYTRDLDGVEQQEEFRATELIGYAPITSLFSNIQQAYTVMLNVIHDGFYIDKGDTVMRGASGAPDNLAYNWLNPWATIPEYIQPVLDWRHETMVVSEAHEHAFFTGATAQQGSEFLSVNGSYLYPTQYAYNGARRIDIDPSVGLTAGDFLQLDYRLNGYTMSSHEETLGATGAYPYLVALPPTTKPYGASVFVNGDRLAIDLQYGFTGANVQIFAQLFKDDYVCVRYYTEGLDTYEDQTGIGQKRNFVFTSPVDPSSVMVTVNGQRGPTGSHTVSNPTTVRLSDNVYDALGPTDVTTVVGNVGLSAGYSVKIEQGATSYAQGVNFLINYTTGQVLWVAGAEQPRSNSTYTAYYTYFPKQILAKLLRLVQPATVRCLLQFTTTDDRVFNPYFFEGQYNPSGDIIR